MAYSRVLLKLSGEALMGEKPYGIDPAIVHSIASDVSKVVGKGTQLAIVCTTSDGAAPTTQGTVGQVYFATVTAAAQADTVAGAGVNAVIIGITTPTATDSTLTLVTTSADSGTPAKFNVFAVTNNSSNQARTSQMTEKINVYSFALKPEEHQPSGTCNFSRIDNAKLDFDSTGTPPTSNIYAVNYNVLRIMSGMGGLAYSN